jgi:hypothetical protein
MTREMKLPNRQGILDSKWGSPILHDELGLVKDWITVWEYPLLANDGYD